MVIEALSLRYVDGRLRLELKFSGPVSEDIMVFAQAPCSPGWKKWRHGTCLGLLPVPQDGISDITEMYLEAFGPPEPGRKVFIRTRQQRDGWEDKAKDLNELVPIILLAVQSRTGVPPFPFPIPKPCRNPVPVWLGRRLPTQPPALCPPSHRLMHRPCTRDRHHTSTGAPPVQCRSGSGHPSLLRTVAPRSKLRTLPESRRIGHWRELWHGG